MVTQGGINNVPQYSFPVSWKGIKPWENNGNPSHDTKKKWPA